MKLTILNSLGWALLLMHIWAIPISVILSDNKVKISTKINLFKIWIIFWLILSMALYIFTNV